MYEKTPELEPIPNPRVQDTHQPFGMSTVNSILKRDPRALPQNTTCPKLCLQQPNASGNHTGASTSKPPGRRRRTSKMPSLSPNTHGWDLKNRVHLETWKHSTTVYIVGKVQHAPGLCQVIRWAVFLVQGASFEASSLRLPCYSLSSQHMEAQQSHASCTQDMLAGLASPTPEKTSTTSRSLLEVS